MSRVTNTFIMLILLLGIGVLLQVFLSGRESRIPGLVLPAITFLYSFVYPLNMMAPPEGAAAILVLRLILAWLLGNIPTVILLAIYFACGEKRRRSKQIDKMSIQDL